MEDAGDGERSPREKSASDAEACDGERESLLASGPNSGRRSGAIALLALVVVVGAAVYHHMTGNGPSSFLSRLDMDLLTHAELSLASREEGGRLTVVPSWPLRLYASLRNDILIYASAAALAGWLWSLAARARARRDAYLIHEGLIRQVDEMRRRLDALEKKGK